MGCTILKFATAPLSEMNFLLCFRIFDQPGLNFNAINLKISQMVGLIEGYKLCELIHSSKIEVRTIFFVWQKFFRAFIKICNIEICNRLL